jgi:hypothetical protein
MKTPHLWRERQFDLPCTVEIEHSALSLHAHVEIDGDISMRPGDQVVVHDVPTEVPFGGRQVVRRTVTVIRAGLIARTLTRIASHFELNQLFEVSFSERTRL